MKYEQKIKVLMDCIQSEIALKEEVQQAVQRGLIDGFLRIAQAEELEQRAQEVLEPERCPKCGGMQQETSLCECHYHKFPVCRIQEGYGYWVAGGYDTKNHRGVFKLPASPDGEPLKEVAKLKEVNGRHTLQVVYPGCYIIQVVCPEAPVLNTHLFRIKRIDRETNHAICERVDLSQMTDGERARIDKAMEVARTGCTTFNNLYPHYYWRTEE